MFNIESQQLSLWRKRHETFLNDQVSIAAKTDIGFKRKTNQDRYLIHILSDSTMLMAVADGLGGEPGGETASGYVIESLKSLETINNRENRSLVSFFKKMDKDLSDMAKQSVTLDGMATTLVAVAIKDNVANWVHSGDSRLYHLRGSRLTQITHDQTLSRFLIDEGEITRQEALSHYSNQVLDQCIGCRDLTPESGSIRLQAQDRIILVSDGLYRYVSDEKICLTCKSNTGSEIMAEKLVNMVLDAGGKDNVTVLIAIFA
ncbi:MAG: serine/threonine-protein phosphatase [Desulfamplus sp.]|nr:serine/threonine-protein phosphatase [Desulfamplus sp.]